MSSLVFKTISLMALTQEKLEDQLSETDIRQIINLCKYIGATHIALQLPLDPSAKYKNLIQPLSAEAYLKLLCDEIHSNGLSIVFRGTFNGIVNEYDFGYDKQTPIGSVESAPTDGDKTWLGRVYQWLQVNGGNITSGDVLALIPEPTNTAFNGNFFLSSEPDVKVNFLDFFSGVHQLESEYVAEKNIENVFIGMTANTYTEIMSEWIPMQLHDLPAILNVDYLLIRDNAETMKAKLLELYNKYKLPIFLQEWTNTSSDEETIAAFSVFEELAEQNILIGLNYWSGFIGGRDDIFQKDTHGVWVITERGKLLAKLYAANNQPQEQPKSQSDVKPVETPPTEQPSEKVQLFFGLSEYDVPFLTTLLIAVLAGAALTVLTTLIWFHAAFTIFTPYLTMVYTVGVGLIYAIFDGK